MGLTNFILEKNTEEYSQKSTQEVSTRVVARCIRRHNKHGQADAAESRRGQPAPATPRVLYWTAKFTLSMHHHRPTGTADALDGRTVGGAAD